MNVRTIAVLSWIVLSTGSVTIPTLLADDDADRRAFFEKKIRPVLVENCYECHSAKADDVKGNLFVDSKSGLREGGDTGPAVIPGNVEESLLLTALKYEEDAFQMPPSGKLSDEVIAAFEKWIEDGAFDPRDDDKTPRVDRREQRAQDHWSFTPPRPAVGLPGSASRIDGWIEAKLRERNTQPAPRADNEVLVQRLYYDLVGLPASHEEVQRFVNDDRPGAYPRLVERLLASPRFGERWARMWLDVARYSDTKGYVFQEDRKYPEAYTFRQWVIEAWNADLSYRDFLRYQLAADQLPQLPLRVDSRAAMGFLTLGRRFLNNRHDIIDDRIDVTTRGMMALTVSCARCHDHKYDAIPAADYYSLYGVFANSVEPKDAPAPLRLEDADKISEPVVFVRGKPGNRGPRVPRRFLTVLDGKDAEPFTTGSGRLELADKIAAADNPLTSRVLVNRVWARLFGRALVTTPSDFGVRCEAPTQRELLDDLSLRFVESGWSLKSLIREIVLSDAYCRSTIPDATADWDVDNRYLSHQNLRRRDFEGTWDAILTQSRDLDLQMGGPSASLHEAEYPHRRGVYAYIDRQNLPGMYRTFDLASPDAHAPRRYETTSPQQALFLLNNSFVLKQSRRVAKLVAELPIDRRVTQLYRLILSRDPTEDERALVEQYVAEESALSTAELATHRWAYGYGPFDAGTGGLTGFTEFPHFSGRAWQGGEKFPHPETGYASWHAMGGHPGDADKAVVRRLRIREASQFSVVGKLHHPADQGDGVRLTIHCHRTGALGSWVAANAHVDFETPPLQTRPGDVIDWIVDRRTSTNHDSFQIQFTTTEQLQGREIRQESVASFSGPQAEPLDVWGRLAQALLLSNELLFVE